MISEANNDDAKRMALRAGIGKATRAWKNWGLGRVGLADMMQSNNLTSPNIGMFVRGDISERTEHPPIGVFVCSMFEFDNEWRAVLHSPYGKGGNPIAPPTSLQRPPGCSSASNWDAKLNDGV